MATVPGFDPEKKTVIQPNLTAESPKIVRALALADLATIAAKGFEEYGPEGDNLFFEENVDVRRRVDAYLNEGILPDEATQAKDRARMLGWTNFQVPFGEGQRDLYPSKVSSLSNGERGKIEEKIFKKGVIDESIEGADKQAKVRNDMTYAELAQDMRHVEVAAAS